ncbi:MAG: GGDEF domain-containing protein, partial [Clostridiales bacterium]|nr:GGDEF domain-containing protein [Clostridiales bacterium]
YEKELNLMAQNRERLKSVWCIVIDINNLKKVNDAMGHAAGDELIRGTVEILITSVRNTSQIYRIGGDEFVIILSDFTKEQMEKLIDGIEENRLKYNQNRTNKVSFAVGYSRYQVQQDVCLDDAIKRADAMMYKNKTNMKFLKK